MDIISVNVNGMNAHWQKIKNLLKTDKNWKIACIQETHRMNLDKIKKWAETNGITYYSNHIENNTNWVDAEENKKLYFKGTGIFIKNEMHEDYKIMNTIVKEHRIQYIKLTDKKTDQATKIWNIYAPAHVGRIQTETYKILTDNLSIEPHTTIVCGDFNIVTETIDVKDATNFKLTPAAKIWRSFIRVHKYRDVWRWHNTWKKLYTVIKTRQSRRVDRIYVSDDLLHNSRTQYKLNTIADHTFFQKITIKRTEQARWGKNYWKNDTRLYEDEELRTLIQKIHHKCNKRKSHYESIYKWWDFFKNQAKRQIIKYAITKRKAEVSKITELRNIIARKQDEQDDDNTYAEIKKLKEIEEKEIQYQCKLHKLKDLEQGEQPTKYFFRKLKQRKTNKALTEIENREGKKLTSKEEILGEVEQFYKNLWKKSTHENPALQDKYIENIKHLRISEEEEIQLETQITQLEIKHTLQGMENDKTPGPDGLSKEFYTRYWNIIKKDVQELHNNAYLFGGICETWKEGATTILYKKGDPNLLKNWRPITLLNTDYKLLTGILSRRLKRILPKLILPTQKCAVANRKISDVLKNIQSVTEYSEERGKEVLIVNLDQQKAFDLVNHTYLYKILDNYGLPEHFTRLIKNIYNTATSKITINGAKTKSIRLERGIRQGCPLSMALYAITCDPLARSIEKNENISGVRIGKATMKLQQYADDMTVFISREKELPIIFREFEKYEMATGQKLNAEKTEILHINQKQGHTNPNKQYERLKKNEIRILGQIYGKNQTTETWKERTGKINRITNAYKNRRLTWMGKKAILNSMVTTQVVYNARVIQMPKETQKEIQSTCFKFLWHPEKMESIARKTLIAETKEGGMGIPDIESRVKACQLESLVEIKKMEEPNEIWHQHAIYELGTKIKSINTKIYSNSGIHRYPTPKKWTDQIELIRKMKWTEEEWKDATHKAIYKKIKCLKENKNSKRTEKGKKINWNKIARQRSFGRKLIKNNERIINYKTAHDSYIFGDKKRQRNITRDKHGTKLDLTCKFCGNTDDNVKHILTSCAYTQKLKKIIEEILEKDITNETILYNEEARGIDWIVLSIYKKTIINLKISLDMDNQKIGDQKLDKKILRKVKKRLENIEHNKDVSRLVEKIERKLDRKGK